MRTALFLLLASAIELVAQVNPQSHTVRGTVRRDGTYVAPHRRTDPNPTQRDNYSTRGNTNPYTGKPGTRTPKR